MSWHRIVCAGALMGVLLAAAPPASAISTIDQNFGSTPPSMYLALSSTGDTTAAESFTVGISGLLTGADLLVFDASPRYLHR